MKSSKFSKNTKRVNEQHLLKRCKKILLVAKDIESLKKKVSSDSLALLSLYQYFLERKSKAKFKDFEDFLDWFLNCCS